MSDDIAIATEMLDQQMEIMKAIKAEDDHDIIRELLDKLCALMKKQVIVHARIFESEFNER